MIETFFERLVIAPYYVLRFARQCLDSMAAKDFVSLCVEAV